jgi:hypothetical protein
MGWAGLGMLSWISGRELDARSISIAHMLAMRPGVHQVSNM